MSLGGGVGINYAEVTRSPLTLISGDALGYVSYFAELLDEWAQDADADERLYRLGASMLEALAAGVPVQPLARYFEYWLLRLQGVYPESRGTLSDGALTFLAASLSLGPNRVAELPSGVRVMTWMWSTPGIRTPLFQTKPPFGVTKLGLAFPAFV